MDRRPLHAVDVAPTLLGLGGGAAPTGLDGADPSSAQQTLNSCLGSRALVVLDILDDCLRSWTRPITVAYFHTAAPCVWFNVWGGGTGVDVFGALLR